MAMHWFSPRARRLPRHLGMVMAVLAFALGGPAPMLAQAAEATPLDSVIAVVNKPGHFGQRSGL